jgi:hypothetical protein
MIPYEMTPESLVMSQIGPVYHGSPYRFTKFKNEAIGTGEGNQAFGYGHYLSESPAVAKTYKRPKNTDLPMWNSLNTENVETVKELFKAGKIDEAKEVALSLNSIYTNAKQYNQANAWAYIHSKLSDKKPSLPEWFESPSLYEATLHKGKSPGEYEYLEWDKPVNTRQRESINKLAAKELPPNEVYSGTDYFKELFGEPGTLRKYRPEISERTSGQELYGQLISIFHDEKKASEFLQRAGISGIKYPSGTLSGMKSDKYNYVVFDPEDIFIESVK